MPSKRTIARPLITTPQPLEEYNEFMLGLHLAHCEHVIGIQKEIIPEYVESMQTKRTALLAEIADRAIQAS